MNVHLIAVNGFEEQVKRVLIMAPEGLSVGEKPLFVRLDITSENKEEKRGI